jgi:hypothetical protein
MDVFRFVLKNDPWRSPRLGALLPDGQTVVDLQAGHLSMREHPSPWLRDVGAFRTGGAEAERVGEKVVEWVGSQRPPGTTAHYESVQVLERVP